MKVVCKWGVTVTNTNTILSFCAFSCSCMGKKKPSTCLVVINVSDDRKDHRLNRSYRTLQHTQSTCSRQQMHLADSCGYRHSCCGKVQIIFLNKPPVQGVVDEERNTATEMSFC